MIFFDVLKCDSTYNWEKKLLIIVNVLKFLIWYIKPHNSPSPSSTKRASRNTRLTLTLSLTHSLNHLANKLFQTTSTPCGLIINQHSARPIMKACGGLLGRAWASPTLVDKTKNCFYIYSGLHVAYQLYQTHSFESNQSHYWLHFVLHVTQPIDIWMPWGET